MRITYLLFAMGAVPAATLLTARPAFAEAADTEATLMADNSLLEEVTAAAPMSDSLLASTPQPTFESQAADAHIETELAEIATDDVMGAVVSDSQQVDPVAAQDVEALVATSDAPTTAVETVALVETAPTPSTQAEDIRIAQTTRPLYRGMSPAYIGVGGNISLGSSSRSATGDFGFAVTSKVSLGPRFSVRPSLIISEDDTSLTVPLTFNFTPFNFGGKTSQFYVGGGFDIGDETAALITGGLDYALSEDFTLTSQANWRVSDSSGLGLLLGIAYNFPWFFE